jgi:hypothetical protein
VLNIWQLLSGDVSKWDSHMLNLLLSWKEMLGLLFWYADGGSLNIAETIEAYELVQKKGPLVSSSLKPFPTYIEARSKLDSKIYDICFHFMKLFVDQKYSLEISLSPLSFSSNKLDYLHSWLLYQVIANAKTLSNFEDAKLEKLHEIILGDMNERTIDVKTSLKSQKLSTSLMFQLESLGLWEWAIFIALFLGDESHREIAIKNILSRNYPDNDDSGSWNQKNATLSSHWVFLVDRLHVPKEWIHETRALKARYKGDFVQEVVCLIDASLFNAAHKLITSKIGPVAVISGT